MFADSFVFPKIFKGFWVKSLVLLNVFNGFRVACTAQPCLGPWIHWFHLFFFVFFNVWPKNHWFFSSFHWYFFRFIGISLGF